MTRVTQRRRKVTEHMRGDQPRGVHRHDAVVLLPQPRDDVVQQRALVHQPDWGPDHQLIVELPSVRLAIKGRHARQHASPQPLPPAPTSSTRTLGGAGRHPGRHDKRTRLRRPRGPAAFRAGRRACCRARVGAPAERRTRAQEAARAAVRAAWKDVQKVLTGLLAGSRRHRPAGYLALNCHWQSAYPTKDALFGVELRETLGVDGRRWAPVHLRRPGAAPVDPLTPRQQSSFADLPSVSVEL
jgi:hypothetical protein